MGEPLSHAHAKLDAALAGVTGPVPSWWECSSCLVCTFGPDDQPPPAEVHGTIGSCPVCSGCTHHLEMLNLAVPLSKAAVKVIRMHYGNTGASLFLATDAQGTEAVLKLHGVATPMVTAGKMAQLLRLYRGRKYLAHELLLARSLGRMADECGLGHINIREWVTRVRAVIPVTGEKIDEPSAVLAEYARGVSLEMLTLKLSSADLLDALAAVPHAALRDAALFDALFVQGDRHAENVFLGDDGYIKLIDSRDQALDSGLDSVFFASAISFERNRVGNEYMFNHSMPYVTHHWPQNTLDYRCHVPGGAIGKNYPPMVRLHAYAARCAGLTLRASQYKACIEKWASSTPNEIAAEYFPMAEEDSIVVGDPSANYHPLTVAARLHAQALSLRDNGAFGSSSAPRPRLTRLRTGFEGALKVTVHKNATGLVPFVTGFPVHEPCCAVVLTDTSRPAYTCAPNGHEVLPADYVYPPLNLSAFVAKYPHTPMPELPPLPKLTDEQAAILAENRAKVIEQHKTAAPALRPAGPTPGAPPLSAADNRAAWVERVGREDIVAAGGDVFEAVPASGFDTRFKNPCWCVPARFLRLLSPPERLRSQAKLDGPLLHPLFPHHRRVQVRHHRHVSPPQHAPARGAQPQQGPALLGRATHLRLVPEHRRHLGSGRGKVRTRLLYARVAAAHTLASPQRPGARHHRRRQQQHADVQRRRHPPSAQRAGRRDAADGVGGAAA